MLQTVIPSAAPVLGPAAFAQQLTELSPAHERAILADAPETLIDAMFVLLDTIVRSAGYAPEIDVDARTLTVESADVRIIARDLGGDRVGLTAMRLADGGLLAHTESDSLGLLEVNAGLFMTTYRADR